MTDVLSEFKLLLAQESPAERGSSSETLLRLMPAATAKCFQLCAIPHEFNPPVLRVLEPDLDEAGAQARYDEFSQLSCVIAVPDGLALHDVTRAELFGDWLKPDRGQQFREANARLVAHYDGLVVAVSGTAREVLALQRMFHLLGADQEAGFRQFESLVLPGTPREPLAGMREPDQTGPRVRPGSDARAGGLALVP